MRLNPKLKVYLKTNTIYSSIPSKALNFKKPKWKIIKKIYKKCLTRQSFINHFKICPQFKRWQKLNKQNHKIFRTRRIIEQAYDQSIKQKEISKLKKKLKNLTYTNIVKNIFLKNEYRIDILLWKVLFTASLYQTRQLINSNKIHVNNHSTICNYYVKKGDIISIDALYKTRANKIRLKKLVRFNPFLEIDHFTGTILIIKNLNEITLQDLSLIMPKRLNWLHLV